MPYDKAARTAQVGRCIRHTGEEFTFGTLTFYADIPKLRPDDPRLQGSAERLIELIVPTADIVTTPPLKRGDSLYQTAESKYRRISRIDPNFESGTTSILITA